jgi:hypothetical protein
MENFLKKVDRIIKQDPGKRNLITSSTVNPLSDVISSLVDAQHIVITTGFFIIDAMAIETDGPPGAILLANALLECGFDVTFVVENHAEEIIKAGFQCFDNSPEYIFLDPKGKYEYFDIIKENTTHFISIERPGISVHGLNFNHRGIDISNYHYSLDSIFSEAQENDITTIAIGDGGNEMGLGNEYTEIAKRIANGIDICTITKSDYPIYAGVSNWACYGIVTILTKVYKKDLHLSRENILCVLNKIVEKGSVDGISKMNTKTVDGLPLNYEVEVLENLIKLNQQ